jgi:hypothetical protein
MVHDHSEVPLAFAVADLVDPDPPEPIEQIDLPRGLAGDALEDLPTDRHATRISSATAVFDVLTASHAT